MTRAELWSHAFGFLPHKILVFENAAKAGTIYLRWRADGNWKWKSLGMKLRDERGRILPERRRMALAEAERKYQELTGRTSPDAPARTPLTIADTWAVVSAPRTGLYPVATRHGAQVAQQLAHAARIWGQSTLWDTIDRARIRMLGRTRVDEIRARAKDARGLRGAIETVTRVLTVAAWLRDEGLIAADACLIPRKWKDDLRDYWRQVSGGASSEPARPRHTLADMRKLLEVAPEIDPRFALLLAFGADLRLGQVLRCRRSDVSTEHRTLTVRSAGRKRGTVVELTAGQWAAWLRAVAPPLFESGEVVVAAGYLAACEADLPDYPLFPRGRLKKGMADPATHGRAGPIDRSAVRKWFDEAEEAAKIPHVSGRGAYGLRRVAVDSAKEGGISREGLQALGGWTTSAMADEIYADRDAVYARKEATKHRARMRGEKE